MRTCASLRWAVIAMVGLVVTLAPVVFLSAQDAAPKSGEEGIVSGVISAEATEFAIKGLTLRTSSRVKLSLSVDPGGVISYGMESREASNVEVTISGLKPEGLKLFRHIGDRPAESPLTVKNGTIRYREEIGNEDFAGPRNIHRAFNPQYQVAQQSQPKLDGDEEKYFCISVRNQPIQSDTVMATGDKGVGVFIDGPGYMIGTDLYFPANPPVFGIEMDPPDMQGLLIEVALEYLADHPNATPQQLRAILQAFYPGANPDLILNGDALTDRMKFRTYLIGGPVGKDSTQWTTKATVTWGFGMNLNILGNVKDASGQVTTYSHSLTTGAVIGDQAQVVIPPTAEDLQLLQTARQKGEFRQAFDLNP